MEVACAPAEERADGGERRRAGVRRVGEGAAEAADGHAAGGTLESGGELSVRPGAEGGVAGMF